MFFVILIFLCACIGEREKIVTEHIYVCPDSSVVSKPENCPRIEQRVQEIIRYRYVCPDGTIGNKSENCPTLEPIRVKIVEYVCPDGSIVNNTGECTLYTTTLVTTTMLMTVPITTIYTISTTIPTTTTLVTTTVTSNDCESLGCPPGTQFVGSKNSNKYHVCDCRYAKKIKSENLICLSNKGEAESRGYVGCGICT